MTEQYILFVLFIMIAINTFKNNFINIISPIFIFSFLYFFLYFYHAVVLKDIFLKFGWISMNKYDDFLFYILTCIIAYSIGYYLYRPNIKTLYKNISLDCFNVRKIENIAIFFGFLGFVLYFYFLLRSGISTVYSGHGQGEYSVGGVIYEMRYFIFSSVAMLLNVNLYSNLSRKGKFILFFFILFLILDAILRHQRGSWVRIFVIFSVSYAIYFYRSNNYKKISISRYIKKSPMVVISAIISLFMMFAMVGIRSIPGNNIFERFVGLFEVIVTDPSVMFTGSGLALGNEFVIAYNSFVGVEKSGELDYGLKWLYPFLNFIPRALWEGKPYWDTFSLSVFDTIDRYSLIIHPPGSAETGAIDTFYRFRWFSPIFFVFLGILSKHLYLKALYGNLHSILLYICFLIGFFYFINQNMFPFVIFTIYMYIPIYFTFLFSRMKFSR